MTIFSKKFKEPFNGFLKYTWHGSFPFQAVLSYGGYVKDTLVQIKATAAKAQPLMEHINSEDTNIKCTQDNTKDNWVVFWRRWRPGCSSSKESDLHQRLVENRLGATEQSTSPSGQGCANMRHKTQRATCGQKYTYIHERSITIHNPSIPEYTQYLTQWHKTDKTTAEREHGPERRLALCFPSSPPLSRT